MTKSNTKPASTEPIKAGDKTKVAAFLITAKRDGFRRAGRAWPKTETRVEIDELDEAQMEAILAEPMLTVVSVVE